MIVSGIELGYWFLQWKKVIESVRDFGIVCGRDVKPFLFKRIERAIRV